MSEIHISVCKHGRELTITGCRICERNEFERGYVAGLAAAPLTEQRVREIVLEEIAKYDLTWREPTGGQR